MQSGSVVCGVGILRHLGPGFYDLVYVPRCDRETSPHPGFTGFGRVYVSFSGV